MSAPGACPVKLDFPARRVQIKKAKKEGPGNLYCRAHPFIVSEQEAFLWLATSTVGLTVGEGGLLAQFLPNLVNYISIIYIIFFKRGVHVPLGSGSCSARVFSKKRTQSSLHF